jgi:hypothetical protein
MRPPCAASRRQALQPRVLHQDAAQPGYEPECLCPCLVCHPDPPRYHRILWVVRELYGDEVMRLMREARERLIGGEPPRDPTLPNPEVP